MTPFYAALRKSLVTALLTVFVTLVPVAAADESLVTDAKRLSFYHTHTRKSLDIVYFANGAYIESALDEIDLFLSDFRSKEVTEMDPALLDLLHDIRTALGSEATYEVISAYRSPKTNEMLRNRGGGVARNSQHLLGKAIDVRLRGVPIEFLRDAALAMKRGGVGFYKKSDFVHVDTGRVRRW